MLLLKNASASSSELKHVTSPGLSGRNEQGVVVGRQEGTNNVKRPTPRGSHETTSYAPLKSSLIFCPPPVTRSTPELPGPPITRRQRVGIGGVWNRVFAYLGSGRVCLASSTRSQRISQPPDVPCQRWHRDNPWGPQNSRMPS